MYQAAVDDEDEPAAEFDRSSVMDEDPRSDLDGSDDEDEPAHAAEEREIVTAEELLRELREKAKTVRGNLPLAMCCLTADLVMIDAAGCFRPKKH